MEENKKSKIDGTNCWVRTTPNIDPTREARKREGNALSKRKGEWPSERGVRC